jgi:hypothetical protein
MESKWHQKKNETKEIVLGQVWSSFQVITIFFHIITLKSNFLCTQVENRHTDKEFISKSCEKDLGVVFSLFFISFYDIVNNSDKMQVG